MDIKHYEISKYGQGLNQKILYNEEIEKALQYKLQSLEISL